ncbi:MAG: aminotransferase class I/II-fold pyridoxal phosphate-dependent enzyme, partial [Halofilum sp. (in: g-proteobacteria)]
MSASLIDTTADALAALEAQGLGKHERSIVSPQATEIEVRDNGGSRSMLNLCANNYLGLADDARLVEVAKEALDSHGFGMASVRFICGTQDLHRELERRVAAFLGTEDAIHYSSCFEANDGFFDA